MPARIGAERHRLRSVDGGGRRAERAPVFKPRRGDVLNPAGDISWGFVLTSLWPQEGAGSDIVAT
jgi:hypothetical protein